MSPPWILQRSCLCAPSLPSENIKKRLSAVLNTVPVKSNGRGDVMSSRLILFASATDVNVSPINGRQAKTDIHSMTSCFIVCLKVYQMTALAINAGGDTNSCMWCQTLGYVKLTPSFMILKYSRNAMILKYSRNAATVAMMIALACLPLWMANGSCGDVVTVSRALSGTDVTTAIQKVLDSGARQVVLDRAGSPYVTCPLFVRSNTEI